MSQFGKASAKRSKPSYANTIVGIALVLFLFGLVGGLVLNLKKVGEILREHIQVHAWITPTASQTQIDSLTHYIAAIPYVKSYAYVTKDSAIKKYSAQQGGDTAWKEFINSNPLPASIDFYVKADHVDADTLNTLSNYLDTNFAGTVESLQFPKETIINIGSVIKYITIGLFAFAVIFSIIVIVSIDTTIRLAMYSNRFLIKTMQMVGATRGFIVKPLIIRAVINGLIAASIAVIALFGFIWLAESFVDQLKLLRDTDNTIILAGGMLSLGVLISLLSTYRSALKYLRIKLDDLY